MPQLNRKLPRYLSGKPYIHAKPQILFLAVDDIKLLLKVECKLVDISPHRNGQDKWNVSITGPSDNSIDIDYSSGMGNRVYNVYADAKIPSPPLAQDVMESIGSDLMVLQNLPYDEGAALDTISADYGIAKPSEALKLLRDLRKIHDDVKKIISTIDISDFIDWTQSDQMRRDVYVPNEFKVILPEILVNECSYRAYLNIALNTTTGGLTTELKPVDATNNAILRMSGEIYSKTKNEKFFSPDESGMVLNKIQDIWGNIPEVARIVDIGQKYHNNNICAGTEEQETYLESVSNKENGWGYDESIAELMKAGLYVNEGYTYGSKWLLRVIPEDIINEIKGWKELQICDLVAKTPIL